MNNGGLYKNINMSLKTANFMVFCAIGLLIFCFLLAVGTAEKTGNTEIEYSTGQEMFP